jgi:hypothetical protein
VSLTSMAGEGFLKWLSGFSKVIGQKADKKL